MPTIVEMPRLSDTMEEGTLAGWLKVLGDSVEAGDALADIETDKAVMTFESFDDGVLLATLIEAGDTVPLGAPICVLGEAGEDVSAMVAELKAKLATLAAGAPAAVPQAAAPPEPPPVPAPSPAPPPVTAPEPSAASDPTPAPVVTPAGALAPAVDPDGNRILASPLARRIAAERGVDLATVRGTGPRGRIVKADVADLPPTRRILTGIAGMAAVPRREDEVVRVTQMRKTIARRLVESKQQAPHYYLSATADAGALVALRKQINASQDAVKISYNDLIMKAAITTLAEHPDVNVGWEGATIRRFAGVHLGFAVALDAGLITPVVRDADQLGLLPLAASVRDLAERARAMTLQSADYTGNSFTISNLGMFGIAHFTAIINPPAACILAVGALKPAAVVRDGSLEAGHTMTMTLSCDHRAVDGAVGAAFMRDLVRTLEAPTRMLLG